MMNFRSLEQLSLTSVSRLEHSIGIAYLMQQFVSHTPHLRSKRKELLVACLFHDVNCGAFGHSIEWAIDRHSSYDHESAAEWIVNDDQLDQLHIKPKFLNQPEMHRLGKQHNLDFEFISDLIQGKNTFLLNNSGVDLDNIDNVCRMAIHQGILTDREFPIQLVQALTHVENLNNFAIRQEDIQLVEKWLDLRSRSYKRFIYSREYIAYEYSLFQLISELVRQRDRKYDPQELFHFTDEAFLWEIRSSQKGSSLGKQAEALLLHQLPCCYGLLKTSEFERKSEIEDPTTLDQLSHDLNQLIQSVTKKNLRLGIHLTTDKRKTNRKVDFWVERNGTYEKESLGEDRSELLLGIVGDKIEEHHYDVITEASRSFLQEQLGINVCRANLADDRLVQSSLF